MSDIGGINLSTRHDNSGIKEKSIETTLNFLVEVLEIDIDRIFANYFSGNTLESLTENKIISGQNIPADKETRDLFKKFGLKDSQLIPDNSPKTFVMNFFPFEYYAGFRSEIFISNERNKLLEIGTFEFLNYRTKNDRNGNLESLEKMNGSLGGCAIGIERLLMAVNDYPDISHCSHIRPLYDKIIQLSENKDLVAVKIVGEVVRFLQAICGDDYDLDQDAFAKRRSRVRRAIRQLFTASQKLKIDLSTNLDKLIEINSKLISWRPQEKKQTVITDKIKGLLSQV